MPRPRTGKRWSGANRTPEAFRGESCRSLSNLNQNCPGGWQQTSLSGLPIGGLGVFSATAGILLSRSIQGESMDVSGRLARESSRGKGAGAADRVFGIDRGSVLR